MEEDYSDSMREEEREDLMNHENLKIEKSRHRKIRTHKYTEPTSQILKSNPINDQSIHPQSQKN